MNVAALQTNLVAAGQTPGVIDGQLGKQTLRALLYEMAPDAPTGRAPAVADALADMLPAYDIWTALRVQHFLAEALHETGGLRWLKEFGGASYFAKYDGREDLGNDRPGDGARFCGRGIFQLTGRVNYARYGKLIGVDLVGDPDLAMVPLNAVKIACEYWRERKINPLADADDIEAVTRRVNGGENGLVDRLSILATIKVLWGSV